LVYGSRVTEWAPIANFSDLIAKNIRTLRVRRGLEQGDVAEQMRKLGFRNWYPQTMSKIERGQRRVTMEELLGLVMVFRTSWGSLLFPAAGEVRLVSLPNGQPVTLPLQHEMPEGVSEPGGAES
jgi:transcriptional regulator with XRE-family HTH domain